MIALRSRDAKLLDSFCAGRNSPQEIADKARISRQYLYRALRREAAARRLPWREVAAARRKAAQAILGISLIRAASEAKVPLTLVEHLCDSGELSCIERDGARYVLPSELPSLKCWMNTQAAANKLGMNRQCLKQLCWKGRVPFAVLAGQWYVRPESVTFVARFPRLHGIASGRIAAQMKREAAVLDPRCRSQQRKYQRRHAG